MTRWHGYWAGLWDLSERPPKTRGRSRLGRDPRADGRAGQAAALQRLLGNRALAARGLPGASAARFGPALGVDLDDVPVEHDPATARALDARAFATAERIVVAQASDRHDETLLAEEAAHVAQARRRGTHPGVGRPGGAPEHEARATAATLAGGGRSTIGGGPPVPAVQRRGGAGADPGLVRAALAAEYQRQGGEGELAWSPELRGTLLRVIPGVDIGAVEAAWQPPPAGSEAAFQRLMSGGFIPSSEGEADAAAAQPAEDLAAPEISVAEPAPAAAVAPEPAVPEATAAEPAAPQPAAPQPAAPQPAAPESAAPESAAPQPAAPQPAAPQPAAPEPVPEPVPQEPVPDEIAEVAPPEAEQAIESPATSDELMEAMQATQDAIAMPLDAETASATPALEEAEEEPLVDVTVGTGADVVRGVVITIMPQQALPPEAEVVKSALDQGIVLDPDEITAVLGGRVEAAARYRQVLMAAGLGGSMASAGADWLADLTASAGAVAQAKVVRPTKAQRAVAVQQGILSPGDVDRMEGGALRDMLDAAGPLGVTVTLRFPGL